MQCPSRDEWIEENMIHTHTHTYTHTLEKGMATHSSILAWRVPWTEESGSLDSMESHRVWHDWSNLAQKHIHRYTYTQTHTQSGIHDWSNLAQKHIHRHTYTQTHTQNGILLSHKKEWNYLICNPVDGPRQYYA